MDSDSLSHYMHILMMWHAQKCVYIIPWPRNYRIGHQDYDYEGISSSVMINIISLFLLSQLYSTEILDKLSIKIKYPCQPYNPSADPLYI